MVFNRKNKQMPKTMSFYNKTDCVWICFDYYDWHTSAVTADCHKDGRNKSSDVAVYSDLSDLCDGAGGG